MEYTKNYGTFNRDDFQVIFYIKFKKKLVFEKKLKGYFWLSAQAGYRINGRFNLVDKYDGQEKDEVLKNNWGNSPFINIGINLVSP